MLCVHARPAHACTAPHIIGLTDKRIVGNGKDDRVVFGST
jgi:hypothetical protein